MLGRLFHLLAASAAFFIVTSIVLFYFSDILPLASTEPQSVWRFEAALLLWKSSRAGTRHARR